MDAEMQEIAVAGGQTAKRLLIILAIVGLVSLGLWIWSLVLCIRNKQLTNNNRIIGIILIVFLGLLGSLFYPFLPREKQLE